MTGTGFIVIKCYTNTVKLGYNEQLGTSQNRSL